MKVFRTLISKLTKLRQASFNFKEDDSTLKSWPGL